MSINKMDISSAMSQNEVLRLADALHDAYMDDKFLPLLSLDIPELDVNTAYRIQREYVRKRLSSDSIAGFKIALTTKAVQEKFGVNHPLSGVLFGSGVKNNGLIMNLNQFKKMLVETEIALVVGRQIDQPLHGPDDLGKFITHVMPAIEVPDVAFNGVPRGVDSIAANTVAKWIITGDKKKAKDFDLNNLTVVLSLNGEIVNQGKGSDVLGDQYGAALWVINHVVEQGWIIKPGNILMTGSFGNILPGRSGDYVADYGDLGKISFRIQ